MNTPLLQFLLLVGPHIGDILKSIGAMDKAIKEQAPLDQHVKDFLTAVEQLVGSFKLGG